MKLTIIFSAILNLCRFGDHVLLFSGSTAMMLVFQASCSQVSCHFFFHPTDRPTQNQETYSTLNERKGDDVNFIKKGPKRVKSKKDTPPNVLCLEMLL